MLHKSQVIETLNNLPETFSIDEIVDKLILISKVEKGEEQSQRNETFSSHEAKGMIDKWSK